MTKFSEYLQQHMDQRGWKQADLVRAAGTSSKNVSVWMSKGVIPNAEGLAKIAQAFGVSEDEVRRAASEAPRTGHFRLSPERQEDADTLDREQARIVDDLIRKFAEDNRKAVVGRADGTAPMSDAGETPATDTDDKVAHLWSREKAQEGGLSEEEAEQLAANKLLPEDDEVQRREHEWGQLGEESQDPDQ